MIDIDIRKARAADVPGIVKLWSELQAANAEVEPRLRPHRRGTEWYSEYMEMQLEDSATAVYVAVAQVEVVGFTFGQIMQRPTLKDGRCGFVADLCVRSAERRQGIGRRLYNELKDWFDRRDITSLEVQVVSRNEDAAGFWNTMGFGDFMRTLRVDA